MTIAHLTDDAALTAFFPVISQLRPHLTPATLIERVRRQEQQGYRPVGLYDNARVPRAYAGFRFMETLFSGAVIYVDDLVTDAAARSTGCGKTLLNWLIELGRREGCATLELDSGVQRFAAHRFYFRERLEIEGYHFRLRL